jgi:uncharacterized membrane protein YtjA (UPF0391 family)
MRGELPRVVQSRTHEFDWHGSCNSASSIHKEDPMLYWAAVFFVIALIAAIFGFGGIAAGAASAAKLLFLVFIVLAVLSFLLGRRTPV